MPSRCGRQVSHSGRPNSRSTPRAQLGRLSWTCSACLPNLRPICVENGKWKGSLKRRPRVSTLYTGRKPSIDPAEVRRLRTEEKLGATAIAEILTAAAREKLVVELRQQRERLNDILATMPGIVWTILLETNHGDLRLRPRVDAGAERHNPGRRTASRQKKTRQNLVTLRGLGTTERNKPKARPTNKKSVGNDIPRKNGFPAKIGVT